MELRRCPYAGGGGQEVEEEREEEKHDGRLGSAPHLRSTTGVYCGQGGITLDYSNLGGSSSYG